MSNLAEKLATENGAELDAVELREWLDSLDYVMQAGGPDKVERLLRQLRIHAQHDGVTLPYKANTPYINTIGVEQQPMRGPIPRSASSPAFIATDTTFPSGSRRFQ
jgi:pyruvate dehydrogenase complex dehydrogenase (E1) component